MLPRGLGVWMCLKVVLCQWCQLSLHLIYLFIWQMGRRHLLGLMLWGPTFLCQPGGEPAMLLSSSSVPEIRCQDRGRIRVETDFVSPMNPQGSGSVNVRRLEG